MVEPEPVISVVVACVRPRRTLGRWLDAVAPQARGRGVELLVAVAGDDKIVRSLQEAHRFVLVTGNADALVPALWGLAMARARGTVIVVTISACIPSADWLDTIVASHAESDYPGIGGIIELGLPSSVVDRAIHLVRYTPYLPPLAPAIVPEIAGDNGTYKRAALSGWLPAIERDGFWEADIHRILRGRGERLWLDPRIRVTFSGSHSILEFSRQRYLHGRMFGRARARSHTPGARAMRALLAPLVPPFMLARVLAALGAKHRLDASALLAAPLAAWFFVCWAAGEAAGLLARGGVCGEAGGPAAESAHAGKRVG